MHKIICFLLTVAVAGGTAMAITTPNNEAEAIERPIISEVIMAEVTPEPEKPEETAIPATPAAKPEIDQEAVDAFFKQLSEEKKAELEAAIEDENRDINYDSADEYFGEAEPNLPANDEKTENTEVIKPEEKPEQPKEEEPKEPENQEPVTPEEPAPVEPVVPEDGKQDDAQDENIPSEAPEVIPDDEITEEVEDNDATQEPTEDDKDEEEIESPKEDVSLEDKEDVKPEGEEESDKEDLGTEPEEGKEPEIDDELKEPEVDEEEKQPENGEDEILPGEEKEEGEGNKEPIPGDEEADDELTDEDEPVVDDEEIDEIPDDVIPEDDGSKDLPDEEDILNNPPSKDEILNEVFPDGYVPEEQPELPGEADEPTVPEEPVIPEEPVLPEEPDEPAPQEPTDEPLTPEEPSDGTETTQPEVNPEETEPEITPEPSEEPTEEPAPAPELEPEVPTEEPEDEELEAEPEPESIPGPTDAQTENHASTSQVRLYNDFDDSLKQHAWNMANKYGVSYEMVLGIMCNESRFQTGVTHLNKNGTTDWGIMQINDVCLSFVAARVEGINTTSDLLDPYKNIEAGCTILAYHTRNSGGDEEIGLLKYQVGAGNAKYYIQEGTRPAVWNTVINNRNIYREAVVQNIQ